MSLSIDTAKKLIQRYVQGHASFMARAFIGERYYKVNNDICLRPDRYRDRYDASGAVVSGKNPMRSADNRIPFSFYPLLVNQKAAYLFTTPPMFDVGSDEANQRVAATLGDTYAQNCKQLCVEASNAGIAWLHYWKDERKGFRYAVVPSVQIIPVWSQKLDKELLAVLRVYTDFDESGDTWNIYEYWTASECQAFQVRSDDTRLTGLAPCPMFTDFYVTGASEDGSIMPHPYGCVPFIPFCKNNTVSSNLSAVKQLIDTYDKTFSGFVDDLEDIQEVILVLTNYGGEDMKALMDSLKYYKAISLDSAGDGDHSGISTLSIEIPVDARDKLLEITRKAIFSMGQGVDPEQQGLKGTSGEAMKFLYALLEMKAGLMETEFRLGFNQLIRAILNDAGMGANAITQTWTRTSIRNDAELTDMCAKSVGIVSSKTILKNHPFVESVEQEERELAHEKSTDDDVFPLEREPAKEAEEGGGQDV